MTPESRKFRAEDARQLLENKLFREAFERVDGYIDSQALSCSPDDKDRAHRIILAKQILAQVHNAVVSVVQDGELARLEIEQIERQRGFMRHFKR